MIDTPHACPSCKSDFLRPHGVATVPGRPDIVVVTVICDACGHHGWKIEKPSPSMDLRPTNDLQPSREERHLPASSENAIVDYFRCDRCGHAWTLDKDGARRDVTIDVSESDKGS